MGSVTRTLRQQGGCLNTQASSLTRPNILFLLIDCLRADAILGSGRCTQTPTLDELVRSGVACRQVIASSSTTPPCVASLLTGTYSHRHGIRSLHAHKLHPKVISLASAFQEYGYHTRAEVTGPLFPHVELNRGFDVYNYRDKRSYLSSDWGSDFRNLIHNGDLQQPWFCLLHLWEIHQPRQVPPSFRSRAYGHNRYEQALSNLDVELGRLLVDLPENTLVVVHGDHGEHVVKSYFRYRWYRLVRDLTRGRTLKREGHEIDVSETLIRVPLVFYQTGDGSLLSSLSKRLPYLVRQIDILPTLLDLIGAPVPAGIQGTSFLHALKNGTDPGLEAYVEAFLRSGSVSLGWLAGWRTGEWKYIYMPDDPDVPPELYHIVDDPAERKNLAAHRQDIVCTLRERIEAVHRDTLEPLRHPVMSAAEKADIEKRLEDLGYM